MTAPPVDGPDWLLECYIWSVVVYVVSVVQGLGVLERGVEDLPAVLTMKTSAIKDEAPE